MKNLSHHIEYLLLEHDFVIVPALGTFQATYREARYVNDEQIFLPPMRSVVLNTDRKQDDGVFCQCLIDLHNISKSTALRWISEFVSDINETISEGGAYEVGSIGNIVMDNGSMVFNACEAGADTPEYFGLTSLPFELLPVHNKTHHSSDNSHITISLRRSTMRRVAAIAAILVIALMIIVPGYNHFNTAGKSNLAQIFSTETIRSLTHYAEPQKEVYTEPTPARPAVNAKANVSKKKAVESTQTDQTQPETLKTTKSSDDVALSQKEPVGFVIVLASAIPQKNADEYVSQLKAMGMTNISAIMDGKMLRVIQFGFGSEDKALSAMRKLRNSDNKIFSEVWLKKL